MLTTIGDLVEDVVARLGGPVNVASDTAATIERRQGGSAANVAVAAGRQGFAARFVGQVGDDAAGAGLVADLHAAGVDAAAVRRHGRTGTIVVLVDASGERSMLTDRGASVGLDTPDPSWLERTATLHVPLYSLSGEPLASTTATVISWAHDRGIAVSIDLSSVALIEELGTGRVRDTIVAMRPAVVFANADEARVLGLSRPLAGAVTVIKAGPDPVTVLTGADRFEVAVDPIGPIADTTGAGDAFAAGYLTFGASSGGDPAWARDPAGAVAAANRAAATHLTTRFS